MITLFVTYWHFNFSFSKSLFSKMMPNFVSLPGKLNNPYCHNIIIIFEFQRCRCFPGFHTSSSPSGNFSLCVGKVEGHLNPGLFNPKLQPQTFQPWTFQPRIFQPWIFEPWGWKVHGWKVHGWKVWGWKVQGCNVL